MQNSHLGDHLCLSLCIYGIRELSSGRSKSGTTGVPPLCLVVLLSAYQQVFDGQPEAVVEMNRHHHQAVVDQEGRLRAEDVREPLDHHEGDVLYDDEQWPDIENTQRLIESQQISPIFPTETTENNI